MEKIYNNSERTVKEIPLSELMLYYKPEEIHGYCRQCPNHNQYWSCPPHNNSIQDYLSQFNWAYIMGTRVFLNSLPVSMDPIKHYHERKKNINLWLINEESRFTDSTVLISGHCEICPTCSRQVGECCSEPSKQRYSLESLGFKISDLITTYFNDNLQWKGSKVPDYLYIVTGLLSASRIEI